VGERYLDAVEVGGSIPPVPTMRSNEDVRISGLKETRRGWRIAGLFIQDRVTETIRTHSRYDENASHRLNILFAARHFPIDDRGMPFFV
jgi:hypothetical protein